MNDNEEYLEYMSKSARGICPVCDLQYTKHEYPKKVACPKCNKIDDVVVWEAWGHPDGNLYCQECVGFNNNDPMMDYWTFHVENGQTVSEVWTRSETDE